MQESCTFKTMHFNYTKILLVATLMLLASFLIFWLYGEYEREKEAVQNKIYLEVAEKLIGYSGGNFKEILAELENIPIDGFVKVGMVIEDSLSFSELHDRPASEDRRVTYFSDNSLTSDTSVNDRFKKVTKTARITGEREATGTISMVIEASRDSFSLFSDSLADGQNSQEFIKTLRSNLSAENNLLNQKVVINILPQILFAVLLFGLLTLGIYLLQKSHNNQQELLENKNNLISNITHEFQTPISTIAVALEAIQDFNVKSDPEKTNRYIETSRNELRRLSSAVDQVMLLNKMDNRSSLYQVEKCEIPLLCREVIDNLEIPIAQKEAAVLLHFDSPFFADVDPVHFKNMLHNLIDNSLKYGKQSGRIDIVLKDFPKYFVLEVRDDGPGIAPKYHQKIFERFYRIPSGDRHNVKGYGLGLSYVKEIVIAHQGKIQVKSKPDSAKEGEGTLFIIQIPKPELQ